MKQVTIHSSMGDMTLSFLPDKAPEHVANFVQLAESGFYDGIAFHRVMDEFMIQGGCPKGDGTGSGPNRLKAEFNDTPHVLGTLSMARSGDPDSASSQFFICLGDASFLDGQYSAFGRIADDASLAVLLEIGKIPVTESDGGEQSAPVEPVTMERMSVLDVSD